MSARRPHRDRGRVPTTGPGSATSARATRPSVAYQGEPGAYGEEAVIGYFGTEAVQALPLPTFSAVCAAVEERRAVAAVLPLENSLAGTVGDALDALVRRHLRVAGELLVPIRHRLLALPGVALEDIRGVASHWQALAQCERYLGQRGWQLIAAADTAGAARELTESQDRRLAAIASDRAARRYGLTVLTGDIQDEPANLTRFAVLVGDAAAHRTIPPPAGPLAPPPNAPRDSLVLFQTAHVAGALHRALGAFAEAGVNLSRIESRPSGDARWSYQFLLQVEGDATDEPLRSALRELERRARALRTLGSFPSADRGASHGSVGKADESTARMPRRAIRRAIRRAQ